MIVLELETTIRCGEASIGAEMRQRGNQALIDVERGELVQLLEQVRSLGHYLREERNDLRGPLAHHSAKLSAAEKHCPGFFRRACISDVLAVGSKAFAPESLARRSNHGNEAPSDFDLVAQNYMPIEHDEHTIGCRAALIELESCRPRGARAISADRSDFFWT